MANKNIIDINPEEREIKEWRAAKRLQLRNEYIRELYDPYRNTPMVDEQILRFASTRNCIEKLYEPTLRNVLPIAAIAVLTWFSIKLFNRRRDEREHLYRTGQVKYKDRMYKFTV